MAPYSEPRGMGLLNVICKHGQPQQLHSTQLMQQGCNGVKLQNNAACVCKFCSMHALPAAT